ncbi:hypothetical protein ACS0TY_021002 [Phlomoides rotata]
MADANSGISNLARLKWKCTMVFHYISREDYLCMLLQVAYTKWQPRLFLCQVIKENVEKIFEAHRAINGSI